MACVLIVDNGTKHLRKLKQLLAGHDVRVVRWNTDINAAARNADLVVLSGSSLAPVRGHTRRYRRELAFIKTTKKPIIGICLGFELIATAFGASLKLLKQKRHGFITIVPLRRDIAFSARRPLRVVERHRWVVASVRVPLVPLARSADGIEAVHHRTRPIYGFQFHPELLVKKQTGDEIFRNTVKRCLQKS